MKYSNERLDLKTRIAIYIAVRVAHLPSVSSTDRLLIQREILTEFARPGQHLTAGGVREIDSMIDQALQTARLGFSNPLDTTQLDVPVVRRR